MRIEDIYKIYQLHPSVQTDTRQLRQGDLFFALKGDRFNGNLFAAQALASGAAYAIVDQKDDKPGNTDRMILVDDVLKTLQDLAKFHRQQLNIPFLAITGSNGKTTTKELVHAVLSSTLRTYTTQGNLNNHIGIPLTILRVQDNAQMAVIEMGANHLGEIAGYCQYALPTHAIITNCGKAHLEGFGSIEGVRKGKGELYDYIRATGGTAFVMWDYDYLRQMSQGIERIVTYGTAEASTTGQILRSEPFLEVAMTRGVLQEEIPTKLVGSYNLPNVLAAVAVGAQFGISPQKIKSAIQHYIPSNSRSQLLEIDSNKFIMDAYNANPSSMQAAIENFANLVAENKILVLGAMAELGQDSVVEHQQLVGHIQKHPWKEVLLVGGNFLKTNHPYRSFENVQQAKQWLQKQNFHNAYFLVKGSRSMQMEKILEKD